MKTTMKRILVGMSGGLDSTYAALYLSEQGYHVEGAVLDMSEESTSAVEAAKCAAAQIGVPLHVISAREVFAKEVKAAFAAAYAKGETPNPCVLCNRYVKVACLCDYAEEYGFDHVSTGHYALVQRDAASGRYFVTRASDEKKDQSYVLWALTQKQLSMFTMPLSNMEKHGIRAAAAARGISAAAAKESQDICFLPHGDYVSFVEQQLGTFPEGDFVDESGQVVGRHKGIIRYTVGQRKGLGIALGHPVFVTKIDPLQNTVHLAPTGMEYSTDVIVRGINRQKLCEDVPLDGQRVLGKLRYAAKLSPATIEDCGDGRVRAVFDVPQRAVTPGQSAVFYDAETGKALLFGGFIAR